MKILNSKKKIKIKSVILNYCIILFLCNSSLFSQSYQWTGAANNQNFFDELNWIEINSANIPPTGTINPNQVINFNLYLSCEVNSSGFVLLANNVTLNIQNGSLNGTRVSGGNINIGENGYLNLTGVTPLVNTNINFSSPLGWLKLTKIKPINYQNNYFQNTTINQIGAIYPNTLRIDNYYDLGSLIRINSSTATPMEIFDSTNLQGNNALLTINNIHSGNNIPLNLNNNIRSFILKRGFMAVIADNEEGTGKSKVYIASEKDLVVNSLPSNLIDNVSFIRIVPWNWVTKKGTGGDIANMDNTWFYKWSNNGISDINREYAPMAWGWNSANDSADIELYKTKYKATHVLSFNEADDCNGQSGQYGNLCDQNVAVTYHQNLMKTGIRIVSPSCREGAWSGWLNIFNNLAVPNDIRFDVVGIHWYDWGGNPINTPNESAISIFNRFKAHLTNVHNLYNLPIWITEFNANPHRNTAVQLEFMQLALPYLETLSYVERYAWFQPSSGTGSFLDSNGNLTAIGTFYKNHISTPSISSNIYIGKSNIDTNTVGNVYTIPCDTILLNNTDFEDNTNSNITIYPNPAKNLLHINCKEFISKIIVYDTNGRIMNCEFENNCLNISTLQNGIYSININNFMIKFIKI